LLRSSTLFDEVLHVSKDTDRHAEMVGAYFDTHADSWNSSYRRVERSNDIVLTERLDIAIEMTRDLEPGSRVLDAGCGAGPMTIAMARRGHEVVAVDLSGKMLEQCRQSIEEQGMAGTPIDLRLGNLLEIDLPAGSFHAVIALGFLQYQDDEIAALRRLNDLLRPGGVLVVSGPIFRRLGNLFGLWVHVQAARRRLSGQRDPERERLLAISKSHYSAARIKTLLETSGFRLAEVRRHGYVNFAVIGPWLGTQGEIALHRGLTRVSKALPIDYFANDLVARAVKA
jgi:2-polyprenyl-3-methyl-5-hydroxy-6-metoxy-1,4-benzoquinol methylase